MDLCATGCHYTASGIVRDLKDHPEHLPPLPSLTPAQYTTLGKIAQGGTSLSRSLRGGREYIRAGDGSTIRSTLFHELAKNQLIRIQQQGISLGSQNVTLTAAGRLTLDTQKRPHADDGTGQGRSRRWARQAAVSNSPPAAPR